MFSVGDYTVWAKRIGRKMDQTPTLQSSQHRSQAPRQRALRYNDAVDLRPRSPKWSNAAMNPEPLRIAKADYGEIIDRISVADSPVGIDAQYTHAIIIRYLQEILSRVETLESRER